MNPILQTLLLGLLKNPAMMAQIDAVVLALLHRAIDQFVASLSAPDAPVPVLKARTRRKP